MMKVVLGTLLSVLTIETLFLVKCFNQKSRSKLNPVSSMSIIWIIFLNMAFYFGERFGFYAVDFSCIASVFLFLNILVFVAWAVTNRYEQVEAGKDTSYEDLINSKRLYSLSIFAFALFAASNIFYFRDLGRYISLTSLYANIWRWKNLVLTGVFSEDSFLYIGRNLSIFGTIFSLNLIVNWRNKGRRYISLVFCLLYVMIVFLNPRRDPMIDKLVFFLCPLAFMYRNKLAKLYKIIIPIGIAFTLLFVYISNALTFGQRSIIELAGRYTFAPFNSLQSALDNGYPANTDLLFGNTFYFVYTVLKFISPRLAPPNIVLSEIGSDTGNVYTALIAPLIDSHGSLVVFHIFLIIYAIYIGLVIGISQNLINKYYNLPAFIFYSGVFACAVRTFYNPTFSYVEVLGSVLNAVIVYFLINNHLSNKQQKAIS